jgi:hypothetical protein
MLYLETCLSRGNDRPSPQTSILRKQRNLAFFQYHYNGEPMAAQVQVLIRLVLNTIQAQSHKCRSLPSGGLLQQQLYAMSKLNSASVFNSAS